VKIRWKLLLLLLTIAMTPMVITAVLHRIWTRRLGFQLAEQTRNALVENARQHLLAGADDYGRILQRDKKALEQALIIQAREVERRLAAPPPPSPRIILSQDYDNGVNLPPDLAPSKKHFRQGPDGRLTPTPVTYTQQVYFLAADADRKLAEKEMAQLSTMPEVYRSLYEANADMTYWQYTGLESGLHCSYPGHGGYPPDYDPRVRRWYKEARASGKLTWLGPASEVSTRTITLALSMPVRRPDGTFAGVTATDVPLVGMFSQLRLPERWSAHAETAIVVYTRDKMDQAPRPYILAHQRYVGRNQNWQQVFELEVLESDDPDKLAALVAEAQAGKAGVRLMRYNGNLAFWAHAAGGPDVPFPVVILPYEIVVAGAVEAEQYVLAKTFEGLKVTGMIVTCVLLVVAVAAFFGSRLVTRPVRRLAEASEGLARGDRDVRVDIRTGDELQELGESFNKMVEGLEERDRLKQAMALAMEIQQHLLPEKLPDLECFDVSGGVDYCDETGGDYYDFIEIMNVSPSTIGLAIGDITGHGIGAALLMASARAVLRSHAPDHGDNVHELFDDINVHLVRDTGEMRFLTLFYGVLDAEKRSLVYASAGHDPGLWYHAADRTIDELGPTGIPLGILDSAEYTRNGPLAISPGDVVVLTTDGVREAANNDGEMFGTERLKHVILNTAREPAREIQARIVQAVRDFQAGHPQQDDITLVVAKCVK